MLTLLEVLLLIILGFLAFLVGYLLLLTLMAFFAKGKTPAASDAPKHRFLFLIPAHNEEKLLPATLANLQQLDYPHALYAVHVVADNCTDKTAVLAMQQGAIVHERFNNELRGKGYALQWLLQRLWGSNEQHDAVIILDADSVVSPNFLRVMDAKLSQGANVVQAYYAVRDPEDSWSVGLRYAALAVLHYLRPQGRMVLSGSAGLKGNGMVFTADLMKQHKWSASVTEDIEFHMGLILAGERVIFAPDAVVWAEMPNTLADSQTQNARWESGRLEMARTYVPKLLGAAVRSLLKGKIGRAYLLADAAMEHIIPPFTILAALSGLALLASFLLPGPMYQNVIVAAFILLGQLVYLLSGLILVRAPRRIYLALLYTPFFMVWKIWLYGRVVLRLDQQGWVRTARNEER